MRCKYSISRSWRRGRSCNSARTSSMASMSSWRPLGKARARLREPTCLAGLSGPPLLGVFCSTTYPLQLRPRLAVCILPSRAQKGGNKTWELVIPRVTQVGKSAHWVPKWLKPSGGRDAVSAFFRKTPGLHNPPTAQGRCPSHSHSTRPSHGRFHRRIPYGTEAYRHARSAVDRDRPVVSTSKPLGGGRRQPDRICAGRRACRLPIPGPRDRYYDLEC